MAVPKLPPPFVILFGRLLLPRRAAVYLAAPGSCPSFRAGDLQFVTVILTDQKGTTGARGVIRISEKLLPESLSNGRGDEMLRLNTLRFKIVRRFL